MDRFSSLSFESVGALLHIEVGEPPSGVGYESNNPAQQATEQAETGVESVGAFPHVEVGEQPSRLGYESNNPAQQATQRAGIGFGKLQQLSTGKGAAAGAAKAEAGQDIGWEEQPEPHSNEVSRYLICISGIYCL